MKNGMDQKLMGCAWERFVKGERESEERYLLVKEALDIHLCQVCCSSPCNPVEWEVA